MLRYIGRFCVLKENELQERIMTKSHSSRYFIHLGSTKIVHNLKDVYLWNSMKSCIAYFVATCQNRKKVKIELQSPLVLFST